MELPSFYEFIFDCVGTETIGPDMDTEEYLDGIVKRWMEENNKDITAYERFVLAHRKSCGSISLADECMGIICNLIKHKKTGEKYYSRYAGYLRKYLCDVFGKQTDNVPVVWTLDE